MVMILDLLVRLTILQKTCLSIVWVMILDLVEGLTRVQYSRVWGDVPEPVVQTN